MHALLEMVINRLESMQKSIQIAPMSLAVMEIVAVNFVVQEVQLLKTAIWMHVHNSSGILIANTSDGCDSRSLVSCSYFNILFL